MKRLVFLVPVTILLAAAAPFGKRIAVHGNGRGALPCMACHGTRFEGNASIGAPRLAGLPDATTLSTLDAIASGTMGKNYVMRNVARSLTPAERKAVAGYLAGLKAEQ